MSTLMELESKLAAAFDADFGIDAASLADDVEVIGGDIREVHTDLSVLALNRPSTK